MGQQQIDGKTMVEAKVIVRGWTIMSKEQRKKIDRAMARGTWTTRKGYKNIKQINCFTKK